MRTRRPESKQGSAHAEAACPLRSPKSSRPVGACRGRVAQPVLIPQFCVVCQGEVRARSVGVAAVGRQNLVGLKGLATPDDNGGCCSDRTATPTSQAGQLSSRRQPRHNTHVHGYCKGNTGCTCQECANDSCTPWRLFANRHCKWPRRCTGHHHHDLHGATLICVHLWSCGCTNTHQ